jgi:hypothetical protein
MKIFKLPCIFGPKGGPLRHVSTHYHCFLPSTCVKTYAIDVNTSHVPEEGAHSQSWPNGLIIIIIVIIVKGGSRSKATHSHPLDQAPPSLAVSQQPLLLKATRRK